MKLFISWSKEQSGALAQALHQWLPLVLHYIEPWVSQEDIKAGDRWAAKITEELSVTNFGIICVTKENVNAPWLLFEAGALAKSMEDGKIIPLLYDIDVKEITGPLTQFQIKKFDKSGISDIICSINKTAPSPVPEDRLKTLFDSLWIELEKKISNIPTQSTPEKKSRPQNDILEELVSSVRGLDVRLRDNFHNDSMMGKRRKEKIFHPQILREVSEIFYNSHAPIEILFFLSFLRDDLPWLYEYGIEAYKNIQSSLNLNNLEEARDFHKEFMRMIEKLLRNQFFMEEFINKNIYIILHETFAMLEATLKKYDRDKMSKSIFNPSIKNSLFKKDNL